MAIVALRRLSELGLREAQDTAEQQIA